MGTWPYFSTAAEGFYKGPFARALRLFRAFQATGSGSGRRAGPRELFWQTVAIQSVAALEAGIEDLVFAAHAHRLGVEGQTIGASNAPDNNVRKWLAEDRLMAPNGQKIERVLFADFGISLGQIPPEARFSPRRKLQPHAGSGRGSEVAGPTTWNQLKNYLSALNFIRNAAAHADVGKLGPPPGHLQCRGDLWLTKADGNWSVQQPHALTALRTSLSTFNTVAVELSATLGTPTPTLTSPSSVVYL